MSAGFDSPFRADVTIERARKNCSGAGIMSALRQMQSRESQRRATVEPLRDQASSEPYLRKDSAEAPSGEDNCPVIRANQVFLSAATSGRLRVVFF
jgi:hypothetical protein